MAVFTFLCLTVISLIVYKFLALKWKLRRLPPGPSPLPLIGNLLDMQTDVHLMITGLRKFGEVCTLSVFHTPAIVLNSYKAVHEAFVTKSDAFSGRPISGMNYNATRKSGIGFTEGDLWQEHRRFCVRVLRDLGFGKNLSEEYVRKETANFVNYIDSHEGEPIATIDVYSVSICNVIARLVFGERVGSKDEHFLEFYSNLKRFFATHMLVFFPVLNWIVEPSPIAKLADYVVDFRPNLDKIHFFIRDRINEREAELRALTNPPDEVSQASDLCDALLIEKMLEEKKNPDSHTYHEWQLIRDIAEVFSAAIDTTATTLHWTTLLIATHPDVQLKVQKEISDVIGHDRLPVAADRQNLPYLCAVMDEGLRFASIFGLSLLHRTTADTDLFGFDIPEDTTVIANLYGIHRDPELWKNPDHFDPNHFLDDNGRYQPSKFLLPFSIGKRACLGEALARLEYFIMLCTVMQSFNVQVADPNEKREDLLRGTMGLTIRPKLHKILFTKRSQE